MATDVFGRTDPKKMPPHFFFDAIEIDYSTAIQADVAAQDFSVAPRHWYVDARFRCVGCKAEFVWSAQEQKAWFETYAFYVDARPQRCRDCRAKKSNAVQLRKDYDSLVAEARSGGSAEQKRRIVQIVDDLESYWSTLPEKMRETRALFRKQLVSIDRQ